MHGTIPSISLLLNPELLIEYLSIVADNFGIKNISNILQKHKYKHYTHKNEKSSVFKTEKT